MPKIHITLEKSCLEDKGSLRAIKEQVVQHYGLRDVNEKRLERYGILSGTVDNPENIRRIRSVPGVGSVNEDGRKTAT